MPIVAFEVRVTTPTLVRWLIVPGSTWAEVLGRSAEAVPDYEIIETTGTTFHAGPGDLVVAYERPRVAA